MATSTAPRTAPTTIFHVFDEELGVEHAEVSRLNKAEREERVLAVLTKVWVLTFSQLVLGVMMTVMVVLLIDEASTIDWCESRRCS